MTFGNTLRLATGAALIAGIVSLPAMGQEYEIRFGNLYPEDHSIGIAADRFAELVEEKTDGRAVVEVFHNGVLGSEREMAEAVKTGSLEMVTSGLAGIGLYVPGVHVFELPYLYGSMEELQQVTAELEPEIQDLLVDKGFHSVGFNYQGPRSTASVRPLRSLADFEGLKLRVPEAPLYVGMAEAMGTTPTPVAYPEVYTSLQTGIVEAMEGSPDSIFNNKFYEVANNLSLTQHIYHVLYMALNQDYFASLPEDIQNALIEAGREAAEVQLDATLELNEESLAAMREEGVEVIELADLDAFKEALRPFNDEYAESRGEDAVQMLGRIREITGQ